MHPQQFQCHPSWQSDDAAAPLNQPYLYLSDRFFPADGGCWVPPGHSRWTSCRGPAAAPGGRPASAPLPGGNRDDDEPRFPPRRCCWGCCCCGWRGRCGCWSGWGGGCCCCGGDAEKRSKNGYSAASIERGRLKRLRPLMMPGRDDFAQTGRQEGRSLVKSPVEVVVVFLRWLCLSVHPVGYLHI